MGDVIEVLWEWFHHWINHKSLCKFTRFADEIKIKSLPVVSAVTSIDLEENATILELHDYFLGKNNKISFLSTFQVREAGVIVNDIARRHNVKENIE